MPGWQLSQEWWQFSQEYALVAGFGDNASFSIDGTSLLTAVALDYETTNSYSIQINVNDGTDDFVKEFIISINRQIETIEWQDDGEGWIQYYTNDNQYDDTDIIFISDNFDANG